MHILEKRYWLVLLTICAFAFATRMYKLGEVKTYVFDEVYHAITAKLIARNDVRAFEWWNPPVEKDTAVDWLHPPLAKYTQALSMRAFGETPFGWRFSSVVFGVLVIFATAEFTRYLFEDRRLALLAGLLASLDGLLLTQSRIAMNDIHVTLMLLLTFFSYAWYRKRLARYIVTLSSSSQKNYTQIDTQRREVAVALLATGLCIGLSLGSKWSGFFGFLTIWGFEFLFFLTGLHQLAPKKRAALKEIFARVIIIGILPFFIYVLSYAQMFYQGKTLKCDGDTAVNGQCYCNQNSSAWVVALESISGGDSSWEKLEARGGCKRLISHFSELHHQIWWYQTNLKATHGYQSRPLQWFLNLKPVWFYVKYEEGKSVNIYAQGNSALFWLGDIAVGASVIMLSIYTFFSLRQQFGKKRLSISVIQKLQHSIAELTDFTSEKGQLFFVTVSYFAVWLPWQLSPRIMFFYHYTPAVPLLAILLSYWLIKLSKERYGKQIVFGLVAIMVVTFVVFYPNWVGIPVSKDFADKVYFTIKPWK